MSENDKFYQRKEYFEFNLLSKVSKEEIKILNERDNTLLYSFILIFSVIVVYFVLTLLDSFAIAPRIQTLESRDTSLDQRINQYDNIRQVNGEIVRKSRLLEESLAKDIKLTNFFSISEDIIGNLAVPSDYKRNADGRFEIRFIVTNFDYVNTIFLKAKSLETIAEVRLENLFRPQNNEKAWSATISFKVINE